MKTFRGWLVEKLAATKYATDPTPDDKLDEVAERIGVQPDVLLEARVEAKIALAKEARQPRMGRKRTGTRHYQIMIFFPESLFIAWKKHASDRGTDSSSLLRSVIHTYLMGSYEPEPALKNWVWQGRHVPCEYNAWYKKKQGPWPWRERALIPRGARRAFEIRAQRRGASMLGLLRALIVATMEGRFARHGQLQLVDARTMYDDEERYYLGGDG